MGENRLNDQESPLATYQSDGRGPARLGRIKGQLLFDRGCIYLVRSRGRGILMVPDGKYSWVDDHLVGPNGVYGLGQEFSSAGSAVSFETLPHLDIVYHLPSAARPETVYIVQR